MIDHVAQHNSASPILQLTSSAYMNLTNIPAVRGLRHWSGCLDFTTFGNADAGTPAKRFQRTLHLGSLNMRGLSAKADVRRKGALVSNFKKEMNHV